MKGVHPMMKYVWMCLSVLLLIVGLYAAVNQQWTLTIPPWLYAIAVAGLAWGTRAGRLVFGHLCVVAGCYLVTWGIYLLPQSSAEFSHILWGRPLFWGLFSIFGGICAIYHAFCRCIAQRIEHLAPLPKKTA
jgi:hypothetical protein